ncbi:MAG: sulfatase-like hydrolase/transferase [Prolixibacteraceae bacterium]
MRNYIIYLAFTLALWGCQTQDKPNILWFVSEDNSPYLGAYGDVIANTPHLDQFAKQGITFTNAFSNAPVCAPSRSTLITGMYPPTLGSENMRCKVEIDSGIVFFPQYLKKAGYFNSLRLKRDYNIPKQDGTWDIDNWWNISDAFKGRADHQPFFMFYNTWMTHEGKLHTQNEKYNYFNSTFEKLDSIELNKLKQQLIPTDPEKVQVPAFLPDLPEVRKDIAAYYDCIQMMDLEFAHVLNYLEEIGELENTIIIYSSDHGGVLARTKRFTFETGLHIPFLVRFPKKFKHLSPAKPGESSDQMLSFVDMAPTLLQLAGIEKPDYMQGKSFLKKDVSENTFEFGFRGRMDECYDLVRTIRTKKYRYIRNYMPHLPGAQHIRFLWDAPNVQAIDDAFKAGKLNEKQAAWFLPKAVEELYDCTTDPENVNNLAGHNEHQNILEQLRKEQAEYLRQINDIGFIPEGYLYENTENGKTPYMLYARTLPIHDIISAAEQASNNADDETLLSLLTHSEAAIRFWGSLGCIITKTANTAIVNQLKVLLSDDSGDIRAVAANALYNLGETKPAIQTFEQLLESSNPYVVLRTTNAIDATGAKSSKINNKIAYFAKKTADNGPFDYVCWQCEYINKKF